MADSKPSVVLNVVPTIDQINADRITQLASKYWAPNVQPDQYLPFDKEIIENIYNEEILKSNFSVRRIMILEYSQYLENFLWPHYKSSNSSYAHIMSIVIMLNEKFRERVAPWEALKKAPNEFDGFINQVLHLCLLDNNSIKEQISLIVFLNHCFQCMETDLVRNKMKKLVSISIWCCLQEKRRLVELRQVSKWQKLWNKLQKKDKELLVEQKSNAVLERTFLHKLCIKFITILESISSNDEICMDRLNYCERFLEMLIDLETSLPTRRFFHVVLDDIHLIERCFLAPLCNRLEGHLFQQLLDILKFYFHFEICQSTGDPLTENEVMLTHYENVASLQTTVFGKFMKLQDFSLSNISALDKYDSLLKHFKNLSNEELQIIAMNLNLIPDQEKRKTENWYRYDSEFLLALLVSRHEARESQLKLLNSMPLYPTEDIIWNEAVVPTEYFNGNNCLALPKLNLQFLTLHDYLLRNFQLFRLESTYEIRQDIEDTITRMNPCKSEDGNVYFSGYSKMSLPIDNFLIVEVAKPNLGDLQPSRVRADVSITLNVKRDVQEEWENIRKHDVCFLITVKATQPIGSRIEYSKPFLQQTEIVSVRGCEVEGMLDNMGRVIEEGPDPKPELPGQKRTYRVWLDCNQYRKDLDDVADGKTDVYESFNVLMRRKPKENNFKAVLETIRHLMNTECVVPEWIHDIILGYGDPSAAHYNKMPNRIKSMNFNDTFLDIDHLLSSFPSCEVIPFNGSVKIKEMLPPFRIHFQENNDLDVKKKVIVQSIKTVNRGPYQFNLPKKNTIRFTPTQIEAIYSGMQPGLTVVVGPPGTGKTDVAVQIISNLYHNWRNERTMIVTHSNQALNQLFEKIMALDIDERHLLRLGHGEEALETDKDFSRYGRVNYVLAKRLQLLDEVQRLQHIMNVKGDMSYTCETAMHFFWSHVLPQWDTYLTTLKNLEENTDNAIAVTAVQDIFPFTLFFSDAPQPLFNCRSLEEDKEIARGCFRHIKKIFKQLDEFRAFELLRTGLDRSRYLLVKEVKIIAMTCTHAALKRKELIELGFKYDNILMEESAQILEIETFIPLLLQNSDDGFSRLKRWIMIGDHHQLPPVIKNMAFQKYSNMEQSLFTRMVNLGVPTIDLDAQGRARPSLSELYNWRYNNLGNLGHVLSTPEYHIANAGFCYEYQLIDVGLFNGVGETEPNPHFIQNLAEAEYCVSVYMYMRLIGYPADKITILSTYNGQKHLIREIINMRCGSNPLIGWPHKVTTVDKYQGQQNDYILLSLVRTKTVGHLRDVRRLVVAMSRARLGLYIFANASLFGNCFELSPTFNILSKRPLKLHLLPSDSYPTNRSLENIQYSLNDVFVVQDMPEMAKYVFDFYLQRVQILKQIHLEKSNEWIKPGTVEFVNKNKNKSYVKEVSKAHLKDTHEDKTETNSMDVDEIINED
ncbi:RNA helicase aquarius [Daktulosphaira vitifoliae]|uniref:RNA helicase aquarius n=1 Tax=Daktulosphaira vitifoliae TaxID=58002 RepID=UPI0021AAEC8C|nr:RNA helicase aquarius [Daktulosphaira vitifoliae]